MAYGISENWENVSKCSTMRMIVHTMWMDLVMQVLEQYLRLDHSKKHKISLITFNDQYLFQSGFSLVSLMICCIDSSAKCLLIRTILNIQVLSFQFLHPIILRLVWTSSLVWTHEATLPSGGVEQDS